MKSSVTGRRRVTAVVRREHWRDRVQSRIRQRGRSGDPGRHDSSNRTALNGVSGAGCGACLVSRFADTHRRYRVTMMNGLSRWPGYLNRLPGCSVMAKGRSSRFAFGRGVHGWFDHGDTASVHHKALAGCTAITHWAATVDHMAGRSAADG